VRQGYGLPRDGQPSPPATIPPMPVAWTPEVVRALFPIRIGLGQVIALSRSRTGAMLSILRSSQPKDFPATVQGWVDLWTTMAATTKPEKLRLAHDIVDNAKRAVRSTPFRDAEAALKADALGRVVLPGLVFLGGHGYGDAIKPGAVVDLRSSDDSIMFTSVTDAAVSWSIEGYSVLEIEASGPGATTAGAFLATSGHGLVGDLMEQASAQWMTDRFGTKTIVTLIRLETDSSELFLRSVMDTPESAQIALSPLRALGRARAPGTALAAGASEAPTAAPADGRLSAAAADGGADDLVSRLERLARLRDSGALSEVEYQLAKAKILS